MQNMKTDFNLTIYLVTINVLIINY